MPIGAKHSKSIGEDRPLRTPPHLPLKALREVTDTTLEELAIGIGEILDSTPPSRGTLSAIETGRRGASRELLSAIEEFFHLSPGTITTTYRPRPTARRVVA
ncbi:helix-turn-helix domain-containing protein [Mycobacterium sp. pUA109]|uniref:helix-turn-helix domain-containing protein n=1 Tax=Mycobacterium sp. pUA109 TaxID=3238982 RepID=UPI00351B22B3